MDTNEVLGVDIGGVITDRVNDGTDTSFLSDNYLKTTAVPGTFEALRRLVDERFGADRIYLVSKCGKRVQEKSLHWLAHHRFYEQTGILPKHVFFCRERHEKAGICRQLGITHFVDDRLEVLGYLADVGVEHLFLFKPSQNEMERYVRYSNRVRRVNGWEDVLHQLLSEAIPQ